MALAEKETLALASPLLSLALSKGHSGNLRALLHPPSHSAFVSIFCVFPGGEVHPSANVSSAQYYTLLLSVCLFF